MGVLSRIATWYLERTGTIEDWFREFTTVGKSRTGIMITQLKAMQASAVMACVTIISEDVAKLPGFVYRMLEDGSKQIVTTHAVSRLLLKPNARQTWFEFAEMIIACLLLRGVGYAAVIRNGRGEPMALIPVNPDIVTRWESPAGLEFFTVMRNTQYLKAALASLPNMIPAEDMFQLKWLSLDGTRPMSRIQCARETMALAIAQEQHSAQFFGNFARPAGVLQTDKKLGAKTIKELKAQWDMNYGGENTSKTAVLEEGLKFEPITMSSVDAQFLESRRFQKEEIATIFRMPPHKLGISSAGTATNYAQADQDYLNSVVSSYLERLEAKMDDFFGLIDQGLHVEFDTDWFFRADFLTRMQGYKQAILGMVYTPNDARKKEGLSRQKFGDSLYQPVNVAPIGFIPSSASGSGNGPGSDLTDNPGTGGDGDGNAGTGSDS